MFRAQVPLLRRSLAVVVFLSLWLAHRIPRFTPRTGESQHQGQRQRTRLSALHRPSQSTLEVRSPIACG
jgi:hypothetical protein